MGIVRLREAKSTERHAAEAFGWAEVDALAALNASIRRTIASRVDALKRHSEGMDERTRGGCKHRSADGTQSYDPRTSWWPA